MAINLAIPIPNTNVTVNYHHVQSCTVTFRRNGLLLSANIGIGSYVDNVATAPIITDSLNITPTPVQVANMITFLQAAMKLDAKYAAGTIVADPA